MRKLIFRISFFLGLGTLAIVSCHKKNTTDPSNTGKSSIITATSVQDLRDNRTYQLVNIGGQVWMAENLNYGGTLSAGYSSCPDNSQDSCNKYGRFYTLDEAKIACPSGFHLPTDEEWRLLEHNLGMTDADTAKSGISTGRGVAQAIGIKLQKGGSSGFNAIIDPTWESPSTFWTSTQAPSSSNYWYREVYSNDSSVYRKQLNPAYDLCVRCLEN